MFFPSNTKVEVDLAWYRSMDAERQLRLQRNALYWDFYMGKHWRKLITNRDTNNVYDDPDDDLLVFNYCRTVVNKSATWLFAKGIEFIALDKYDSLIPLVNDVWEANKKDQFLMSTGKMGGITGDVWVRLAWDTTWNEDFPIRLILLDSSIVDVETDPHDIERIEKVIISYPFFNEKEDRVQEYREELTKEKTVIKIDGETKSTEDNIWGFIPVVHFQNSLLPSSFWGTSDLVDIIPINEQLNKKDTDISDIINYHAEPITCVFGAKMQNINQGDGKVWSNFPKDARVQNLELTGDLKASNEYIAKMKESLHEISEVPSGSLNTMTGISNASGIGLHIQFLPLIEKTLNKQITYGEGIKEINRLILKIAEKMGFSDEYGINWDTLGKRKYTCINTVFEMPLPKDMLIELQIISDEIRLKLESRKGAMERLKMKNIPQKMKDIEEDTQQEISWGMDLQKKKTNIGGIVQTTETPQGAGKNATNAVI